MDKRRLQAALNFLNDSLVNVTGDGFLDGHLDVEIDQLAVIYNGHPFLFQMNRVDKHLFFHNDPFVGFQYSAIAQARCKEVRSSARLLPFTI